MSLFPHVIYGVMWLGCLVGVFCEHQHPPPKIPTETIPKVLVAHFPHCRVHLEGGMSSSAALGEIQRRGVNSDLPQVQDVHPQRVSPLACGWLLQHQRQAVGWQG